MGQFERATRLHDATIANDNREKTGVCLSEGAGLDVFTAEVRSVLMNNALVIDGNTGLLKLHKQPDGIFAEALEGVLSC